ncbi:50S ribosomal protein L17 [Janthinobacterium sp. MP5059B]|uniref:50S ribosomal protein L17 n=1 Tax=Janthinobacterium sp. MP5059B TaxID=1766683 RepID=UPI0008935844|nr:50S ribosomal protein L17 [Janthinobacterium sp. MP5059B]OEZ51171.1 50S ribosomal protein L17 [Janthinobacterium sp. MP5059B]
MRHGHGLRKLNRTSSHRLAMLRNMTVSLTAVTKHESKTTLAKSKRTAPRCRANSDPGQKNRLPGANKRLAFNRLRDREMVVKLFAELGPRFANRNGGYVRILKMGFRVGDNAPMAFVELMDRPDTTEAVEVAGE